MIRRGVLSILLVALIAAGMGWREATPETRTVDGAVSLPRTVAAAIDAVVRTRADVGGFAEQRSTKARARLGLFVVVSPALLMAMAISYLHQLVPGRPAVLRRRHRIGLRAPPLLKLS